MTKLKALFISLGVGISGAIVLIWLIHTFWGLVYAQEIPQAQKTRKSVVFAGKLDRTTPSILLESGSVKELLNMRRPFPGVALGWAARSGTTKHNTTAIAGTEVKGLFQYVNKDFGTRIFTAQTNDAIYLSDIDPPATGASFGSSIYTLTAGTSPAFADHINDDWVGAATGTTPWAWSGGTTYPDGFLVKHETGTTLYVDGWNLVRNNRKDSNISLMNHSGASEVVYFGFRRRLDGILLDFVTGATNVLAAGVSVQAWDSGTSAWSGVASLTDNTDGTGGVSTFYESGSITWTYDATDDPYLLPGTNVHQFWYRMTVDNDIDDGTKVYRVRVNDEIQAITSLWSGFYDLAVGALKSSVTGFTDYTGDVTDGTDVNFIDISSLLTTEAMYVGFVEPAFGVYLQMVPGKTNLGTAANLQVKYWDGGGNAWTSVNAVQDGTSFGGYPLGQTGIIQWDGRSFNEDKRVLGGGIIPLFWYELTWTAALPADIQIWEIAQAAKPGTIPPVEHYDGVIEFNGRALWWPGKHWKNGVDFSQDSMPHILTGQRAGQTGPIFGPGRVNAVARLSSYAIVSTKNPYRLYLLQGKVPGKFDELMISDHIGVIAPHTLHVIDDAVRVFRTTRTVHAGIFMAPDGFYMTAGDVVANISQPIADYFDTGATPYIEPSYANISKGWIDYKEKTVHFAVPLNVTNSSDTQTTNNREIVYSYLTDEWFDVYQRSAPAASGLDLIGSDDQRIAYIGDYAGGVYRSGVSDTDYGNNFTQRVKTTDILPLQGQASDFLNYSSRLRRVKLKAKAQVSGNIDFKMYPDGAEVATLPTGVTNYSMVNSGYAFTQGRINTNLLAESFAFTFESGVTDNETMEVYGFTMDYEPVRETQ